MGLLSGTGLEIGALHAPTALPAGASVQYIDAYGKRQAAELFPELDPEFLVEVDHVIDVDVEGLTRFATGSQDFVIANMVLDHLANPVRLLAEAFRVLRPGGHLGVSVPDRRFTADRLRESTPLEQVLDAYRRQAVRADDDQYLDHLRAVNPRVLEGNARAIDAAVRRSRSRRESVHVWDSEAFSQLLEHVLPMLGIDAECLFERTGEETGLEHFSVWCLRSVRDRPQHRADAAGIETQPVPGVGLSVEQRLTPARDVATPGSTGAVLLCGMHRSGTSALAKMLGQFGIWLGDGSQMLEAHSQDNPEGYWERRDVHDAHVQFLHDLNLEWDRLSRFTPEALNGEAARQLRHRLKRLLPDLAMKRPWLLKDPRLSLVLPIWRELAPDSVVVVAVRHPLEICESLAATPRGIYPAPLVLALWEKYLLRLLHDLNGRPAIFVSYASVLASPEPQIERLARLLIAAGVELSSHDPRQIASVLRPDLHRNRQLVDHEGRMDHRQAQLYECLLAASQAETAVGIDVADWSEPDVDLDRFEASFADRISRALANEGTVMQRQLAVIEELGKGILQRIEAQVDTLQAQNARQAQELSLQGGKLSDLRARLSEANTRQQELAARSVNQLAELQAVRAAATATAQQVAAMDGAVKAMQGSISWRATAPLRWLAGGLRLPRLPYAAEQRLYRWYYRMPGLSYRRKRALVLWVHRNLSFLTRSTQSYTLFRQGTGSTEATGSRPRMDEVRAAAIIRSLSSKPVISIVMPVFNTDRRWLEEAIESVRRQYYRHWELCIVDDCSTREETLAFLRALKDQRIRVQHLTENQGIARSTNAALAMATGEFIGFLDHDDVLTRDALLEVVQVLQEAEVDLVYSDEDKLSVDAECHGPVYKPDFSPDYLSSNNYFCHFTVARRTLVDRVGGLRYGFDGAQDFDLALRLSEQALAIRHIAKVLYHWRMIPSSTAADPSAKPYTWEAGRLALEDALRRRSIAGRIDLGPYPNTYHLRRDVLGEPLVSIVVPFRDEPELLAACVRSVLEKSTYRNFELVLVDNQSKLTQTRGLLQDLAGADARVRLLAYDQPFNYSALHNHVVEQVRGEYLLLLNNDTEVITPGWIEALLEHAQRPEVAVTGCRLLYADDRVQHAGVIVGIGSFAGHAHHLIPADHPGYMARPHLLQNVSAVTFACALMRTSTYRELDGLDAENLAIAYNDVDFCLRAAEAGKLIVYTPHAELYHFESRSRGGENDPAKARRFAAETAWMQHRHRAVLENGDPYYNINFTRRDSSYEVDPNYVATLPT